MHSNSGEVFVAEYLTTKEDVILTKYNLTIVAWKLADRVTR